MTTADWPPAAPLPHRPEDGHKGTFGTVLVIGGCDDAESCMVGGPAFAAMGALRAGAGRAVLAVPRTILTACLEVTPSATGLPLPAEAAEAASCVRDILPQVQAVVIGPGLGTGETARALVEAVVAAPGGTPVVLDADGLNVFAMYAMEVSPIQGRMVVTPHPGEYDRLAASLDLPKAPRTPESRTEAAVALSEALHVVTVLKGPGTVVAESRKTWTCQRGSVALATGGSGDVLAGIIGGLIAQGVMEGSPPLWDLAAWGTWIHAVSGEHWAAQHGPSGLLAAELAAEVPGVMASLPRG